MDWVRIAFYESVNQKLPEAMKIVSLESFNINRTVMDYENKK